MKSKFHPSFLWLVSLQSFGSILALNHVILFPVFFSIKHNSSSLSFILLLRIFWLQKTLCLLSLMWQFFFPKGTVSFRNHCQELTFVSSLNVPWMAVLWCEMKCFWPEAVLGHEARLYPFQRDHHILKDTNSWLLCQLKGVAQMQHFVGIHWE